MRTPEELGYVYNHDQIKNVYDFVDYKFGRGKSYSHITINQWNNC